jgi:hypothetical protein
MSVGFQELRQIREPRGGSKGQKRQRIEEPIPVEDPPAKKQKIPESPESQMPQYTIVIRNVVPQMCEVSLADIGQQITSISGDFVPPDSRLFFGTVEAHPLIAHVYFIPRLSEIPKEHIKWTQENQGLVIQEKFFVPLEARENVTPIFFQLPDGQLVASSVFVYVGTDPFL